MKTLVTAYSNPDLDGTACAIAYNEYLGKKGNLDVVCALFGTAHREAQFVFRNFNIPTPLDAESMVEPDIKVIILDASDLRGISDKINPDQVIEIIDHRKIHSAGSFPNAKVQIELVGSAATLIAEKFHADGIDISVESAVLLYSAIISNTVNFQANVTTDRDTAMADWLQTKFSMPANYIHTMFADKSQFVKPIRETIEDDFASFVFAGKHVGIAQLEIVEVEKFIQNNRLELEQSLQKIKLDKNLDYIFLSSIDLVQATNTFFVIDSDSQALVSNAVGVVFNNCVAVRQGIMMRKTIAPLIKDLLEK